MRSLVLDKWAYKNKANLSLLDRANLFRMSLLDHLMGPSEMSVYVLVLQFRGYE